MIILPDNIAKTIITVDALSANTIYLVYRSMNGNINLIVNHYGKSGARVAEFDQEMREISKLIRAVRRKYPEVTPVICGDFNVRAKSTRHSRLLNFMTKNDLVPSTNNKLYTWFPQGGQGNTKKPTQIDYIFTTKELKQIVQTDRISNILCESDHCMLKIRMKKGDEKRPKVNRFQDSYLDKGKNEEFVEQYIRKSASRICKQNLNDKRIPFQKIDHILQKSDHNPEKALFIISSNAIHQTQAREKQKRKKHKQEYQATLDKIEQLMKIQITADTNTDEIEEILADKSTLENNKNQIQLLRENQHSNKIKQNYIREADKGSAYHFARNCNKKMDTKIEMIRTEQGENIIDRNKIDNYVHEHFKEKFQTKRQHLDSLPNTSLDDITPKITELVIGGLFIIL